MLKQLSALPSFEIDFKSLEYIFQKKEDSEFEELLDFRSEKGCLTKLEGAYEFMKRAVEVRSKVLPEGHPDLVDAKEA